MYEPWAKLKKFSNCKDFRSWLKLKITHILQKAGPLFGKNDLEENSIGKRVVAIYRQGIIRDVRFSHPKVPPCSTTNSSAAWTSRCPWRRPGGGVPKRSHGLRVSSWSAKGSPRSPTWPTIWIITGLSPITAALISWNLCRPTGRMTDSFANRITLSWSLSWRIWSGSCISWGFWTLPSLGWTPLQWWPPPNRTIQKSSLRTNFPRITRPKVIQTVL